MPRIAVLNAGSSSIKFALFQGDEPQVLFSGEVEQIGVAPHLTVKNALGEKQIERSWQASELDHRSATQVVLETSIDLLGGKAVTGVGHRVVHGGTQFAAPVLITPETIAALKALCPLAPLHQPHNLVAIEAIAEAALHLPQVACFDTAFHRAQPHVAQIFALPRQLTEAGIRRYGFHGLSYEFVSAHLNEVAPRLAAGRVIIAHLGNGASLCALRGGKSIAATMGFTALDGLVMGTRSGAIDPGVLLYLMDEKHMDARALERLLYKESGLLGVSGISSDMRTLRASGKPQAREAIDLFVYRIVREIGSLAAALGGVDGIVFTGGIGRHDCATRQEVIAGCRWLGAELDPEANKRNHCRVHAATSRIPVWVIPTDEELVIARHTLAVLAPD
jgi:acetate kinase